MDKYVWKFTEIIGIKKELQNETSNTLHVP